MRLWLRERARPPVGEREHVEAAKRLRVRTRRQVTDVFTGHYVSAFRGAGIEYSESRAYVPGDDVRSFDWNATARTGIPHVKQHRPERGRTVIVCIDASSTMRFATHSKSKLAAACDAAALLATAALRVGDRLGLLIHGDAGLAVELPPRRGELQLHRALESLTRVCAESVLEPRGGRTGAGLEGLRAGNEVESMLAHRRRMGDVVFRFGDARASDDRGLDESAAPSAAAAASFSRTRGRARGEAVFVLCSDPGELSWPDAGAARIAPAGGAGRSLVFDGDDALARARFERAAEQRVARIARRVRARGDDFAHFRSDRDPLRLWLHFFRSRAPGADAGRSA